MDPGDQPSRSATALSFDAEEKHSTSSDAAEHIDLHETPFSNPLTSEYDANTNAEKTETLEENNTETPLQETLVDEGEEGREEELHESKETDLDLEDEDNAELLALYRIDETSTKLQQEGKYLEALECMERGLVLRQHFFGTESDHVWDACKTIGEMCNLLAMTYLQQEDFPMVLELLKKAEILTERDQKGRAVTYNNLACYYRRQGKLHNSLTYLQKALKIEQGLEDVANRADTHLNLCAVLSQVGRHAGALEHAQSALILLQEELFPGPLMAETKVTASADRIAVLAIAYHNIGVEQEFLKRIESSLESYRKGVEISQKYLGNKHGITVTLNNSYIAAKRTLQLKAGSERGRKMNKQLPITRKRSPKAQARWESMEKAYGHVSNEFIVGKGSGSVSHP